MSSKKRAQLAVTGCYPQHVTADGACYKLENWDYNYTAKTGQWVTVELDQKNRTAAFLHLGPAHEPSDEDYEDYEFLGTHQGFDIWYCRDETGGTLMARWADASAPGDGYKCMAIAAQSLFRRLKAGCPYTPPRKWRGETEPACRAMLSALAARYIRDRLQNPTK